MEIASAFVSLLPSARGFGSKLESEVGGEVNSAGKRLGTGFGKVFALAGGALAAAGIGSFLKDSIGEAREAQKVGALTESIIKSTGGAAKISAAQIGDLAGAISLKTGIDDEAIQSGANLLLTFKNVRNEVGANNDIFNRATKAATDLSAAGFGALTGTSKQLGKALNDPVKGISALSKSGVTFTAQQQEQIKTLVESGNTLKAQKIILGEVESQVGGAAAASATYGEKAAVAFGNIKEQVGTALLPVVDGFFKLFLGAVPTITRLIDGIGPAFGKVSAFVAPVVAQIQGFFGGGAGGGILASIQSFGATIAANFLPVLQTMAATFTTKVLPAILAVAGYVRANLFPIFQQVAGIITGQVIPIIAKLAQFFYGTLYPAVLAIVTSVASKLKPVFDQLVATFQSKVLPTVQKLLVKFEEYRPTIQQVIAQVVKIIGKVLEFAAAILGKVLPPVIKFAGFLIANVVPAVASMIGIVIKIIAKILDFGGALVDGVKSAGQFLSGVKDKIGAALDFISDIPGKIKGFFSNAGSLLSTIGGQIVDGLKAGIEGAWHKVTDVVDSLIQRIPKKIREIMGIASPSKVTTVIGEQIIEGLSVGFRAGGKKMRDQLERQLEGLKSRLSNLKSEFSSIAESVSSSFTGNLFSVTATDADADAGIAARSVGQNFIDSLMGKKAELSGLLASFKTLKGWGLDPAFLSQLFASGNGGLITELAGMGQAGATSTAALFGEVGSLSSQLGTAVAANDIGPDIKSMTNKIEQLRADIAKLPKAVEDGAKRGSEDGTRTGNDDRNKDTKQRGKAGR